MKKRFAEVFGEQMDIPAEALADVPLIRLRGSSSISIENHHGILEYGALCIRVAVRRGVFTVSGSELTIWRMTKKNLEIRGKIQSLLMEETQ